MRLATVVSQPPGDSMASCCCPDMAYQRAYVSCTASSASASEPRSRYARLISRRRSLMTAFRPGSGPPPPGPDWVLMVPAASVGSHLPSPGRRHSAPECEAGRSADIPGGCVVVLLTRTHHPASKREETD